VGAAAQIAPCSFSAWVNFQSWRWSIQKSHHTFLKTSWQIFVDQEFCLRSGVRSTESIAPECLGSNSKHRSRRRRWVRFAVASFGWFFHRSCHWPFLRFVGQSFGRASWVACQGWFCYLVLAFGVRGLCELRLMAEMAWVSLKLWAWVESKGR